MSTMPNSNLSSIEPIGSMRLPRTNAAHVVDIHRPKRSLIRRIAGRVMREVRGWMWRSRLSAFGDRSSIAAPSWVAGGCSIVIGDRVRIHRQARLEAINAAPDVNRIRIDDDTVIHPDVHIGAIESVHIGHGVLLAADVYITDHDHDWANPDEPVISNRRAKAAPVEIGDYVWLGERVMVLKGVRIGARSIVGAGSIVTRDIPADCVAVGAPARVVKHFDRNQRIWKDAA